MSQQFPRICSLDELKVHLPDDVREHLTSQYVALFAECDEETGTSYLTNQHMDKILQAMKRAPATTVCRVNLIRSSRQEVIDELEVTLKAWRQRQRQNTHFPGQRQTTASLNLEEIFHDTVTQHAVYDDLVMIESKAHHTMSHCRMPPTSEMNLFPTWKKRVEKEWPMNYRVIICDRMCGEAVLRGSDIFVRGIRVADNGIVMGEQVAVYADLQGGDGKPPMYGLLLERYAGQCVFLGVGIARCNRSEMFERKSGMGVEMVAGPSLVPLNNILSGKMFLQNLPSTLVARALDPQKGNTILDMCCAPGGKTTHLASLVQNDATIVACDKSRKKMVNTNNFFETMGATCIFPIALDTTNCVISDKSDWKTVQQVLSMAPTSKNDGLLSIKGFYPESFDRILLDPPCSALGLRPKLRIDAQSVSHLMKVEAYQRLFVRNAIVLLKPGGILVYSTCTINACENEQMVRHILEVYPFMILLPIEADIGTPGLPGMGLNDSERCMVKRFDPSHISDTMGFFVAKFKKCT